MLEVRPLTLAQANSMVESLHRHHEPATGHRFSLGCYENGRFVGAAIVGRPVAAALPQYEVAEVARLVTDGTKNVCSFLYAAAARVAKEMGFKKIQTYILESEPGTSVEAAGWSYEATTAGGDWNHSKKRAGTRRTDQPMCPKKRYAKVLKA